MAPVKAGGQALAADLPMPPRASRQGESAHWQSKGPVVTRY